MEASVSGGPGTGGQVQPELRPRWEWRTFVRELPMRDRPYIPGKGVARESDETYLLSPRTEYNVKVRDGILDIKHLEERGPEGLELWSPVLKAGFPLGPETLRVVCEALGVPAPDRAVPDLPAFLRQIVAAHPGLIAVPIHKRREALNIEACRGEHVTISVAGESWESLSLEDEDPARVLATVRHLGLDHRTNLNYPNALKRILASHPTPGVPVHGGTQMSSRTRLTSLLLAAAALSGGSVLQAQEPGKPVPLPGAYDGGYLVFQSADSAFKYWLDGRIMLDAAWYGGSKNALANGTHVRRARIGVKATLFRNWLTELDVDFAGDAVEMKDLWMGYTGLKNALFRVGNYKEPFSLETLTSSKYITFMERSWIDNLSPDRHIGAGASVWGNRWQASGGIFGQAPPDVDETGQDEATGFTGRVTVAPVLGDRRLIHIGVGASRREPDAGAAADANQQRFRARPETMVNRARFISTGKIKNVDHTSLYNVEFAAVGGPMSLQAEYTRAVVRRLGDLVSAKFGGGYVFGSFFLTGESRPYLPHEGEFDRVIPKSKHGALEIAARFSTLNLNDTTTGVAIKGGKGTNYTLGANWYVNANFKFSVNYVRVTTDENAKPDQGTAPFLTGDNFNILQIRWALAF